MANMLNKTRYGVHPYYHHRQLVGKPGFAVYALTRKNGWHMLASYTSKAQAQYAAQAHKAAQGRQTQVRNI
jgi:hypothetical protein